MTKRKSLKGDRKAQRNFIAKQLESEEFQLKKVRNRKKYTRRNRYNSKRELYDLNFLEEKGELE